MKRSSRSPTPDKLSKDTSPNESKSPTPRPIPNDKVKIYIRLRPLLNMEDPNQSLIIYDQNTIKIMRTDVDTTFMKFDKIFTPKLRQSDIFTNLEPSIQRFLEGENHSFFAYGQTGAGKTYTMIGDFPETNPFGQLPFLTSEHRGILPRALDKIIAHLQAQNRRCYLTGSFYEVYNERVYDLLNPKTSIKREGLELRECRDGSNKIVDLLEVEINHVDDALECLKIGLKNRVTGCSHANTKSSRSHSIFQLVLVQEDEMNPRKRITSKLRIVDLAGSEKFKIPKDLEVDERELHILELTSINGSLSTLGHCITALAEPNRTHIPFRNSRLTRVLSDSLSGNSKITFIVCLSPSQESSYESISTLQFASRAKKIVLDGRHLKKKEEMLRSNMKILNRDTNALELLKKLVADKKLLSEMFDPSVCNKLMALENEIKDLRMQNEDLKYQVTELKRSYTPEPYLMNRSSDSNFPTPHGREYKRSASSNVSPSPSDYDRHDSFNEIRARGNMSSQSVSGFRSRNQSMERKVRFTEDCFTDKVKHELEYQDNSIFENLSIFKDLHDDDPKKKSLSVEEIKKLKEQRTNYLKFWNEIDQEIEVPQIHEEKTRVIDLINTKNQPKPNLLAQKIREKEIERKYELFFSLEPKQPSRAGSIDHSANQQAITTPPNTTSKLYNQNMNDYRSESNQEEHWSRQSNDPKMSKGYDSNSTREPFSSLNENEAIKYRSKGQESYLSQGASFLRKTNTDESEASQTYFNNNIELSGIYPRHNHTIDEVPEEVMESGRKPYMPFRQETEESSRIYNVSLANTDRSTGQDPEYDYTSNLPKNYDSNGMDIIKEFDKKLSSVHQLNAQHQELIKNISQKFGSWQGDSNRHLKPSNSVTNKSQDSSRMSGRSGASKKIQKSPSGRDITQVVREIKQELSDALTQIQHLKLNDPHTSSTQSLSQDTQAHSYTEQSEDRHTTLAEQSLEKYSWDRVKDKGGNSGVAFSNNYLREKAKNQNSNQPGSRAIGDILKKHWSTYKENLKE